MKRSPGKRYSDEDKRNCALHYAILGTDLAVERALNIPRSTIKTWRSKEWWHDFMDEQGEHIEKHIKGTINKTLDAAGKQVLDRIENGDYKVIQGEIRRVPMTGKELATVFGINFDKGRVLDNKPTSITKSDTSQLDRFLKACDQIKDSLNEKKVNSIPGELAADNQVRSNGP